MLSTSKGNRMSKTLEMQDAPVSSYRIASGDMRYIEIGIREIYLRDDPDAGLVFHGEIPDCGSGCYVGLNEILLEYAMSCEGCREQSVVPDKIVWFGEHLGGVLVEKIHHEVIDLTTSEKLSTAFNCILNSMSAPFGEHIKEDHLEFSLDYCPLSECAQCSGLSRSVEMAQASFIALCRSLTKTLAPDWVLVQPAEGDINTPIRKIVVTSL